MACVILIHANNRAEKIEILSNFNDNLNYEVTTDLKKYVAQRYKVRIVEEEEDGGGGGSTQMASIEPVENKDIPLLTPVAQNDQMTETNSNASTNMNTFVPEEKGYGTFIPYRDRMIEPKKEKENVEVLVVSDIPVINLIETDQLVANMKEGGYDKEISANECDINPAEPVPQLEDIAQNNLVLTDVADHTDIPLITHSSSDVGNIENDLNTDGAETDTLCFDIVVSDVLLANNTTSSETPVTVSRSTRSMKRGRNVVEDGDEGTDSQKETTKSSRVDDRPSTSTIRRSYRGSKRPAYSMDDEDGEDDNPVPTKVSSKSKQRKQNGEDERGTNGIECRKCMKQFNAEYRKYCVAKKHAITHTDLVRYECPVDGCEYKCGPYSNFINHARYKHGQHLSAKNIALTFEEEEKLDRMVKECFHEFGTRNEYKVCKVCQTAISNNSLNQHLPKDHSLTHIEFMLYKCNQSKCLFETKWYRHMVRHGKKKHEIDGISKEETRIKLSGDQKMEIDDMIERCFPDEDVDE